MDHDRVEIFRKKLDSYHLSDYHGLQSPGLTCYLNSVLQVLFMTEGFREEIQRCCSTGATTTDAHLDSLFTQLKIKSARTHTVTKLLGITHLYEQRDAAEYYESLLRQTSPEASKMFRGELNHKTRCLHCDTENDSKSNFWLLPLVVEDTDHRTYSVDQGFRAFFRGERVSEDNVMFCNHCSEKRDAEIECEITHSPEVLTLLLKRFTFSYQQRRYVKLHCKVDVPQTLQVKSDTYELYALVNHFGDLTGGHYTAEIRSFETGQWYHFNDDVVTMVPQSLSEHGNTHVRSRTAYLLMYRKGKPCPETTDGAGEDGGAELNVGAGGKLEETERREDFIHHHQLNGDGKHVHHRNGVVVDESIDDEDWMKQKDPFDELDKQRNPTTPRQKPHKYALLHIDAKDLKQKSTYLEMHKGHNEPNTQQWVTDSRLQRCKVTGKNPTDDCRTQRGDRRTEGLSTQRRLKANDVSWEKPNNTGPRVSGRSASSSAGNKGVKTNKDPRAESSKVVKSSRQSTDAEQINGRSTLTDQNRTNSLKRCNKSSCHCNSTAGR